MSPASNLGTKAFRWHRRASHSDFTVCTALGIPVQMSADYKHIIVGGPHSIPAFDRTIPSDWEAVAFPLVAALLTDSCITIQHIDGSGSQGDEAIVEVLQSVGACIECGCGGANR